MTDPAPPRCRFFRFSLRSLIVLVALFGGVLALYALLIKPAREAAVESACSGHLSQLSLAMMIYYEENHSFPPRYVTMARGDASRWRASLLPYIISSGETYNHEHPDHDYFHCPAHQVVDSVRADYLLVAGVGTIFPGTSAISIEDIVDGPENTLMFVESTPADQAILQGDELTVADLPRLGDARGRLPADAFFGHGRGLIFADGTYCRLLKPIPTELFQALMTISGHESVTRLQLIHDGYLSDVHGQKRIPLPVVNRSK